MRITTESADLTAGIRAVLMEAFPTSIEADLVERLRSDGDLVIGLAACEGPAVVGYVALSRMTAPMDALGLGPVAVAPDRQRSGIGSALIRRSLESAAALGTEAVFVLGDPAYYGRFGFEVESACGFTSPYAGPHFMSLALSGRGLSASTGRVDYAKAFAALG